MNASMKVLHIIPSFYPATYHGGTIYSVLGLCDALANQGIELRVLTTDTAGPGSQRLSIKRFPTPFTAGYSVYYCRKWFLNSVSPGMLVHIFGLIRWADVVHLTAIYSFPTIPALLICKLLGKPVVWSPRGALQRWEASTRSAPKAVWERICRMIAPGKLILHLTSEEEAEASRKRFPGVKTVLISNGVDIPEKINPVHGNGVLRLLYMGRIHPIKGIENLLSACKIFRDRSDISWSLTVAGTGESRHTKDIRNQIKTHPLSTRVKMVGEVTGDAKERLFYDADIAIVPSHTENFGMVVAEALAHGVPVIASKGTPWKRVEEIGCGLWVDNDPASLAKAIDQMSQMPLHEMGERGRKWMEQEFSWSLVAKRMIQVYESILVQT
jgi:glycosyltransferase involved in cell wall biosynthesis